VKRLSIFGSALRADFDPSRSDVDLRVEFDEIPVAGYAENYFALREAFADLFGRKVDLISAKKIRNPIFRRELESTQVALYAA
jgi:predicted nucleotidyltransferase